jgi:AraC-like DNA-binding protein
MSNINNSPEREAYRPTPGSFAFELLYFGTVTTTPSTKLIYRKCHEFCVIEYVLEGRGRLEINGEHFDIRKDDIYILHKHSEHLYQQAADAPWQKMFIVIDGEFMEKIWEYYNLDKTYYFSRCSQLKSKFFELKALFENHIDMMDQRAAVIFHQIVMEFSAMQHKDLLREWPEDVTRLKNYLDGGITSRVSLDEFCGMVFRSKPHMIKKFKEAMHITPHEYLLERRIERARLMLSASTLSIKEIAEQLKFSDQYYFSNYFRKKTGVSPREYRRRQFTDVTT